MHYHCEIIMPETSDVESAVTEIMAPFDENGRDDGYDARHAFWNWYVIGGRWSGAHTQAHLDPEALEAFNEWMVGEKVMVSGFISGKEDLADRETVEKVDAKWREMFPGHGEHCLLFKHAGNRLSGDVCTLRSLSERLTASRVIIAAPRGGRLEAEYMIADSHYNGVSWINSDWDGLVTSAIGSHRERLKSMSDDFRAEANPQDSWLAVTVDYHS